MFSRRVLGSTNPPKLNWWQYYIDHCWLTGWQSIRLNFRIWSDLMTGNYEGYDVFGEIPYDECYNCFWSSLNEDDTLPKEFLEYLIQMGDDIDSGKVETIPYDMNMFNELNQLLDCPPDLD
jgi:hypothetical protein